jgi:hypothetical protein
MQLLESTRNMYMLDAGITILREESRDWLNDIRFWQYEFAFYYSLLAQRTDLHLPKERKDALNKLHQELDHFSTTEMISLQRDLEEHESFLSFLLSSNSAGHNWFYRNKHSNISQRINWMKEEMKRLKSKVFATWKVKQPAEETEFLN